MVKFSWRYVVSMCIMEINIKEPRNRFFVERAFV